MSSDQGMAKLRLWERQLEKQGSQRKVYLVRAVEIVSNWRKAKRVFT